MAIEIEPIRSLFDADKLREGIPVEQWRALPDSPTAEPDKARHNGFNSYPQK